MLLAVVIEWRTNPPFTLHNIYIYMAVRCCSCIIVYICCYVESRKAVKSAKRAAQDTIKRVKETDKLERKGKGEWFVGVSNRCERVCLFAQTINKKMTMSPSVS